jgi:hypothetical protein
MTILWVLELYRMSNGNRQKSTGNIQKKKNIGSQCRHIRLLALEKFIGNRQKFVDNRDKSQRLSNILSEDH